MALMKELDSLSTLPAVTASGSLTRTQRQPYPALTYLYVSFLVY